jgi:FkbM family methyltransferase
MINKQNFFLYKNTEIILNYKDLSLTTFDESLFLEYFFEYFKNYNKKINIIDCGANIGSYSIFFSKFINCEKIYSFEPHNEVYKYLKENINLNNCKNINTYNFGLSNSKRKINLISHIPGNKGAFWFWYSDEDHKTPNEIGYKEHESIKNSNIISYSFPLDNFNFKNIDFIKIDVEGMEIEVLNGASMLIEKYKPLLYVEGSKKTFDKIENWIIKNNYIRIEKELFKSHHYLLKYNENITDR